MFLYACNADLFLFFFLYAYYFCLIYSFYLNYSRCEVMSFSQKSEVSSLCITIPSYEIAGSAIGSSSSSSSSSNSSSSSSSVSLFASTAIWLVDDTTREWCYICATFSDYMRLLITHLGVLGWQTAFSRQGLRSTTKEWMCIFTKERLVVDLHNYK